MKRIYEFTDTVEQTKGRKHILPTYVNGILLETKIDGYETLNVYGRELIGRDLDTIKYKTLSKGKSKNVKANYESIGFSNRLISSGYQTRTIVIEFMMSHKDIKSSLREWSKLNSIIHDENSTLVFGDDHEFFYYGNLSDVQEVESNSLFTINRMTFDCLDPFKFSVAKLNFNFTDLGNFNFFHDYPIKIEEIEITQRTLKDRVRLTNITTGEYIEVFGVGDSKTITISYDYEDITIVDNKGRDLETNVLITSDLEDFGISQKDVLKCTSCEVKIKFRLRSL